MILRQKEIKIRLTQFEHNKLLNLSEPQPLASWIRQNALTSRKSVQLKTDPKLLRQLAAIGNNLNQIARAMNTLEVPPSQKLQYLTQLHSIETEIKKLDR